MEGLAIRVMQNASLHPDVWFLSNSATGTARERKRCIQNCTFVTIWMCYRYSVKQRRFSCPLSTNSESHSPPPSPYGSLDSREIITSLCDQHGASFELSAKTNRIMLSVTSRFLSPGTKCEEKKTACRLRLSLLRKLEKLHLIYPV